MAQLPSSMMAVVAPEQELALVERPMPRPLANEVLVKVAAAGVNRPDLLQARGLYPPPPGAPDILGLEIAGEVVAAGEGAGPLVGEQVCALVAGGGYAEYCVAPVGTCLGIPDALSLIEAAAMPETLFTVWVNLFERGAKAEIEIADVMRRRLTLTGSTLRPRPVEFKTMVADEIRETVWPYAEGGKLKPVIDSVFPLTRAAEAHARMEAGEHVGKIVLEVGE